MIYLIRFPLRLGTRLIWWVEVFREQIWQGELLSRYERPFDGAVGLSPSQCVCKSVSVRREDWGKCLSEMTLGLRMACLQGRSCVNGQMLSSHS